MTIVPYRHAVSAALAFVIVMGTGGLHAQGVTDYKPGEGGGPITGSASVGDAEDASVWNEKRATGPPAAEARSATKATEPEPPKGDTTTNDRATSRLGDYGGLASKNAFVSVEVLKSILPQDKDYFPKVSTWGEYSVRVRNLTEEPIRVISFKIVDKGGVFVNPAFTAVELLKQSTHAEAYASAIAIEAVPLAAVELAAAAPTAAAAAAPLIGFLPYLGLLTPLFHASQADDFNAFNRTFNERALKNATLDRDGETTGSVFFPLVKEPRAFVLEYEREGKVERLRITLNGGIARPPAIPAQ